MQACLAFVLSAGVRSGSCLLVGDVLLLEFSGFHLGVASITELSRNALFPV